MSVWLLMCIHEKHNLTRKHHYYLFTRTLMLYCDNSELAIGLYVYSRKASSSILNLSLLNLVFIRINIQKTGNLFSFVLNALARLCRGSIALVCLFVSGHVKLALTSLLVLKSGHVQKDASSYGSHHSVQRKESFQTAYEMAFGLSLSLAFTCFKHKRT